MVSPGALSTLGTSRDKIILGDENLAERLDIEMGALRSGIDGAEVPSQEMLDAAVTMGFDIKKIQAFGVLPVSYEDRVRTD